MNHLNFEHIQLKYCTECKMMIFLISEKHERESVNFVYIINKHVIFGGMKCFEDSKQHDYKILPMVRMISQMYHMIPSNVCAEHLFPMDIESQKMTFFRENDINPGVCDVDVFQSVPHKR